MISITVFSLVTGILMMAFVSLFISLTPFIMPPNILFGVRIPEDQVKNPILKKIRLGFISVEMIILVLLLTFFMFVPFHLSAIMVGLLPLLDLGLSMLVFLAFHYRVLKMKGKMPSALPEHNVAAAALGEDEMGVKHFVLIFPWIAISIFFAVGIMQYPHIPTVFPVHFGINGQPNGFAHKSILSVFSVLIFVSLPLTAFLEFISVIILKSSPFQNPRSPVKNALQMSGFNRINFYMIAAIAVIVDLTLFLSSADSWGLLPHDYLYLTIVPVIILLPAIIIISLKVGQTGWKLYPNATETINSGGPANDDHLWKLGVIYFNRQDSSLIVPKRFGYGYTLNFGHPITWSVLFVVVLVTFIAILLATGVI